jgi:hypothetical protein
MVEHHQRPDWGNIRALAVETGSEVAEKEAFDTTHEAQVQASSPLTNDFRRLKEETTRWHEQQ